MGIYVQQQLEYGKLWKLVEFSQVSPPHCATSPAIPVLLSCSPCVQLFRPLSLSSPFLLVEQMANLSPKSGSRHRRQR